MLPILPRRIPTMPAFLTAARTAGAVLVALTVAGCGGDAARTFGLVRDAPDEFTVTTRAPLSMPPDYVLHVPRPGEARPQETTAAGGAEAVLAPQASLATANPSASAGERALQQAAGPAAPGDIRRKVEQDAATDEPDRSFVERLMFWKSAPQSGVVVDPQREQQRLRENAALGQPGNQGDTPVFQPKSKGFWDWLF
jgi:hypothetical protein